MLCSTFAITLIYYRLDIPLPDDGKSEGSFVSLDFSVEELGTIYDVVKEVYLEEQAKSLHVINI